MRSMCTHQTRMVLNFHASFLVHRWMQCPCYSPVEWTQCGIKFLRFKELAERHMSSNRKHDPSLNLIRAGLSAGLLPGVYSLCSGPSDTPALAVQLKYKA